MKVLVVDDDAVSRLVAEHILVNMGLRVEACDGVDGAMAALSQSLFDLIVCDHLSGPSTGLDLLDEVKGCPIPFVLISNDAQRGEADPDRLAAVSAFIDKPISSEALFAIADEFLNERTFF